MITVNSSINAHKILVTPIVLMSDSQGKLFRPTIDE